MNIIFSEFEAYLFQEKKMAKNSLQAYKRDIKGFLSFLNIRQIEDLSDVNDATIISYILFLKKEGRMTSTINRKVASVRSFFDFLVKRGDVETNPVSSSIKSPKIPQKGPEFLSIEEVENLLNQPDDSYKGIRDKALLELLYATGMRVSEVICLDLWDINLKMGFVAACNSGDGKGRIIPIGNICRNAIQRYIKEARNAMIKDADEHALFVNCHGKRLTRQGLWKIIKQYSDKVGIKKRITPQILRNSFAVHMIQNGADLKSLQELLGHDDAAATQVYFMSTESNIRSVYEKAHPRA